MAAASPVPSTPGQQGAQDLEGTIGLLLTTFDAHRRDVHEDEGLCTLSAGSQPETQSDDCSSFLALFAGVLLQMGHLLQQPPLRPGTVERTPMATRLCSFLNIVLQQKVCPHSLMVFGEGAPDKVRAALALRTLQQQLPGRVCGVNWREPPRPPPTRVEPHRVFQPLTPVSYSPRHPVCAHVPRLWRCRPCRTCAPSPPAWTWTRRRGLCPWWAPPFSRSRRWCSG